MTLSNKIGYTALAFVMTLGIAIAADVHKWTLGTLGSADLFTIYDATNSVSRVAVDTSGNVGVGTTTPSVALEVSGLIKTGKYATASLPTCDTDAIGSLVFDTTEDRHYSCTSSTWKPLDSDYDKDGLTDAEDVDDTDATGGNGLENLTAENIREGVVINGITGTFVNDYQNALTWSGSSHIEFDCISAGGAVFDTGSGTICKITGTDVSCPTDWTRAEYWHQYNSSTARGDKCGNHKSTGCPTTFVNQDCTNPLGCGSGYGTYHGCSTYTDRWKMEDMYNCTLGSGYGHGYNNTHAGVARGRIAIGCY